MLLVQLARVLIAKFAYKKLEHEKHERDEDSPLPAEPVAEAQGLAAVASFDAKPADEQEVDASNPAPVAASEKPPELEPIEDAAPQEDEKDDIPTLTVGADGWLIGEKVVKVPSERCYTWRSKSGKPLGALWHWTSTPHGTAFAMAKRIVKKPGTSVHLWIEHDGTIYQSAPMTRSTGHAGGKTAKRVKERDGKVVFDPASKYDVNGFLLGIEIVCVGEVRLVKKSADGSYVKASKGDSGAVYMGWPFGRKTQKKDDKGNPVIGKDGKPVMTVEKGPIVKSEQVCEAVDEAGIKRCYQDYTTQQVDAAYRLVRAWKDKYGWSDDQMTWGHIDSDPSRKVDPGPRWKKRWMPEILERAKNK